MGEPKQCRKCGDALPAGVLNGVCPRCLMDAAFTTGAESGTANETASAQEPRIPSDHATPAVIARYRIVRLIGEGGMGTVYEAEQEHPRRTVALKVIKPGMASEALLRRFEQEADALGRLQHPGIAQIYEAGTADTGFGPQPYFAMELIRGVSLKEYARRHDLNKRQRVEMMAKVCDAVHHAHQRGLIHRDLKPGNILVDEHGQPKIVDFGVARITDKDAQSTSHTDAGQLIGTLAYMSPEQVLADPLELDTRSDIYTLGVLLYELLAGRLPYTIGNKLHEALQSIREVDPQRLSSVDSGYRGDLETIAAKALEKDKNRRYASAAELGADLRRYLRDEPIVARPPSLSYQFGKFARRHTAVVAGVAAVFVVLVAGIVASTMQAARANRERDRATEAEHAATQSRDRSVAAENLATAERDKALNAETLAQEERDRAQQERDRAVAEKQRADNEAAIAVAVSEFVRNNLFEQAVAPTSSAGATLAGAAAKIEGKYDHEPLVELGVREVIAKAFTSVGATAEAVAQWERVLELRRRTGGEDDAATIETRRVLGNHYLSLRKFDQAEQMILGTYSLTRARFGEEHRNTLESMFAVSLLYLSEGKYADSVSWSERGLAIAERTLGQSDDQTVMFRKQVDTARQIAGANRVGLSIVLPGGAVARSTPPVAVNKGESLLAEKKFEEAEKVYLEALEVLRRSGSAVMPMLPLLGGLARSYEGQSKYAEAEKAYLEGLEVQRKSGSEALLMIPHLTGLARIYERQGKYAEQESTLVKALEIKRRTLGDSNPQMRNDMGTLVTTYALRSKFPQSEKLAHELLDLQRSDNDAYARVTLWTIGWVRLQSGRPADAENSFREALSILNQTAPDSWEKFNVQSMLGASLAAQHKYAEAEPLLLFGYEGMKQRQPLNLMPARLFPLPKVAEAIEMFYRDSGQAEKAVAWQSLK